VHESLRWTLAEPLDPKAAARAEKALAKLPGVAKAAIDPHSACSRSSCTSRT